MASFSLEDYGIIGNFTSAMLVNRVGSVDWACLPYLDSPSHFGAILDDTQGGRFQISPHTDFRSEQRYHQRTLVLETVFECSQGRGVVTDWMPLNSTGSDQPVLYRQIDMFEGKINWDLVCAPRFDYGVNGTEVEFHGAREDEGDTSGAANWSRKRLLFRGSGAGQVAQLFSSIDLKYTTDRNCAEARFELSEGESVLFCWAWGRRTAAPLFQSFRETAEQWRTFAHQCPTVSNPQGSTVFSHASSPTATSSAPISLCPFVGPWHDSITRSGLFLKTLIAPYSGSVAGAITTSIPGIVASDRDDSARTWDYRYSWITQGGMVMQGLNALGYTNEARNYFNWLSEIVIRDGIEGLQSVYTLDGGKLLPELQMGHLRGFHNSRPVRVGNDASTQFHLDIYGHVMLAADYAIREWGSLPDGLWEQLANIADLVCQAWRRPDFGPWQLRTKPEHYVSSKVMCWAALDRAVSIAKRRGENVPNRWMEEMKILHRTICDQGFDQNRQSFLRAFGDKEIDASCLWIPLVGFLPFDDARITGTIDAIIDELSEGVLLHRYKNSDGLPGRDGADLMSSFLLISILSLCGRTDEASDRLAELCTYTTQLGFLGEQVDTKLQETSGNFPSATSHLALINAALYLGAARGRHVPTYLVGSRGAGTKSPVRNIAS